MLTQMGKKKRYAFGLDIGEESIATSVMDLEMDLENPTAHSAIPKHEVISTRFSGELPSDMKTAIESNDDDKVGELQIKKYQQGEIRDPVLRSILLDKLSRCLRQLQEINPVKNQSQIEITESIYDEVIVFIGNYSSNRGGNFASQVTNVMKTIFECHIIDEAYTSSIPCLCNHGLNTKGEIENYLHHATIHYKKNHYYSWDTLICPECKIQANRDTIGSRNIVLKGAMMHLYNVHIYPSRKMDPIVQ